MKLYDVYRKTRPPKLLRKGLTEEQMDTLWAELKWWQKNMIIIKAREIKEQEVER